MLYFVQLNLIAKHMQVYITVMRLELVLCISQDNWFVKWASNVYAITSAEKGKTRTVLSCVSASGYILPPVMVYPRKQSLPEKFKEGAVV